MRRTKDSVSKRPSQISLTHVYVCVRTCIRAHVESRAISSIAPKARPFLKSKRALIRTTIDEIEITYAKAGFAFFFLCYRVAQCADKGVGRSPPSGSFTLDLRAPISRQAINSAKDAFVAQSSTMTGVENDWGGGGLGQEGEEGH